MPLTRDDIGRLFPDADLNGISFLSLMDDFFEGVLITDQRGVVLFMNEEQSRIDNLAPTALVGKKVTRIYHVDDGDSPTMQCIKLRKPIKGLACYYRTWTGKVVNSIHNIFPLFDGLRLIGTVCFIQDFSIIEQRFESLCRPEKRQNLQKKNPDTPRKKNQFKNGTRFKFRDIIGKSRELVESIDMAKLSARSASPVMLFGETGTGKELMAQSIHNAGPRKKKHYVAINCAAIPENLLEGLLFGTAAGAFTGAVDKAGLFERADGGTLFLDEINSMSPGLQAKLLRFIQERKVRRVGALREISIDIKLISSVNLNPHTAIADKSLRSDLFYRLAVVFIRIPPLRERLEDLPLLISCFLKKMTAIFNKEVAGVSEEVLSLFGQYPWPGNVRELEHVIEGSLNLIETHMPIRPCHLPAHMDMFFKKNPGSALNSSGHKEDKPGETSGSSMFQPAPSLAQKNRDNEIRMIQDALARTSGKPSAAARILGISPQLLNYKLKRYRINRKIFARGPGQVL